MSLPNIPSNLFVSTKKFSYYRHDKREFKEMIESHVLEVFPGFNYINILGLSFPVFAFLKKTTSLTKISISFIENNNIQECEAYIILNEYGSEIVFKKLYERIEKSVYKKLNELNLIEDDKLTFDIVDRETFSKYIKTIERKRKLDKIK
jgi:hypothetical protein